MWTFITLILWIGGLIAVKASFFLGGSMMILGVASAAKAFDTPDDIEYFMGLCFLFILGGTVFLTGAKIWSALQ